MGFNTYGSKKRSFGGSYPVWFSVVAQERCGGTLEKIPPVGTVIPAGTLVSLDKVGGTAKIVETYKVASPVSASATIVKVKAVGNLPRVEANMNVMKAPDDVRDTGTGVKVSSVTRNSDGTDQFTITAGALGTLEEGDILILADKAGSDAHVYAIPTGLTYHDVYIEEGDEWATVASVYHGEIMEARIQPIPESVKKVLPQIKFEKGV